jgi:hypothetical protein
MRLGSPTPQTARLLPATGSGSIWVVDPLGCTKDDPANCGDIRGTLFLINKTESWDQRGIYDLSLIEEKKLGYSGAGLYGLDTVELGWPGQNLPSVNKQIIATIATKVCTN